MRKCKFSIKKSDGSGGGFLTSVREQLFFVFRSNEGKLLRNLANPNNSLVSPPISRKIPTISPAKEKPIFAPHASHHR
jgi:hypothetical protein